MPDLDRPYHVGEEDDVVPGVDDLLYLRAKLLPGVAELPSDSQPALLAVIDLGIDSSLREVPFDIGIAELT